MQRSKQSSRANVETLLNDVAQIKEDQNNMAVETGVSEGISGVKMWTRVVQLEEDAAYFENQPICHLLKVGSVLLQAHNAVPHLHS